MRLNDDNRTVTAMDLLVPGIGEIVGGVSVKNASRSWKRTCADTKWIRPITSEYLDLRRYGSVPHSGFGLGFERMLMFVTGVANIRDVIPLPARRERGILIFNRGSHVITRFLSAGILAF